VQVDPIKPKLKIHGIRRLKLTCDVLLSTSAFKFNLRRYNVSRFVERDDMDQAWGVKGAAYTGASPDGRRTKLFANAWWGDASRTLSKPELKARARLV